MTPASEYAASESAPGVTCGPQQRPGRGVALAVSLLVALLLCSAWLVFPYFVQGKKLLFQVGSEVRQDRQLRAISVGQFLSRVADGAGEAEVEVLFATPEYFQASDRAGVVGKYQPNRFLVFVVTESTHTERLPGTLPAVTLRVDGVEYAPVHREGPAVAEHHRTTVFQFPAIDARGTALVSEGTRSLELRLRNRWDARDTPRTAHWQLPLRIPAELSSRTGFTPAAVLALAAGLLSAVLTPCLLQLIVVYLATLTGLTAQQLAGRDGPSPDASRRVLAVALAFVGGFSTLFTIAGAAIGYAGKEMQLYLAENSRAVTLIAGVVMIAMGLWVGVRGRAPVVCRIAPSAAAGRLDRYGTLGPAVMAAVYSLGCMTCFSGAIIATLLIYVGALGSALTGAMVMLLFSAGVAIPFLAAALYLSRAMATMQVLARHAPLFSLASMLVIIAFGLVLLTDNFHALSSAIYPYLGLS